MNSSWRLLVLMHPGGPEGCREAGSTSQRSMQSTVRCLMLLQLLIYDLHLFVHAIDGHLAVGHLGNALQVILSPCKRECNPFTQQLGPGGNGLQP